MDKRGGVITSSKEQMRSSVRVRMQGEITSKGGKDQGGTMDHPRGLRGKVRTSCEKTPYLDRGDDDLKITEIKGGKVQNAKMSCEGEDGSEPAQNGPGLAGLFGSAQGVSGPVRPAL
jgi:hypothetical protein